MPRGRQARIRQLLDEQCSTNLPLVRPEWTELIERIQMAALKGSALDVQVIQERVHLATVDWRDLLVQAGFETLEAHLRWYDEVLVGGAF